MICSKPFQLWPCVNTSFKHHAETSCCALAAVSFPVLSDPTAPDFREESLSGVPERYIPVADSKGLLEAANEMLSLRNVALSEKKETN